MHIRVPCAELIAADVKHGLLVRVQQQFLALLGKDLIQLVARLGEHAWVCVCVNKEGRALEWVRAATAGPGWLARLIAPSAPALQAWWCA